MPTKIKLAIGIANTGSIKTKTVFSLFRVIKDFPFENELIFQSGCAIHHNREKIVEVALEKGCTHVLFVDSDMYFEVDALFRLFKHKKEIIGVDYNKRTLPPISTLVPLEEPKGTGLIKCLSLGTGFLLIDLSVFKKLPRPWFFWKSGETSETGLGEDYWFCERAREAGYDIWADLDIPVKHIGDYLY